MELYKIMHVFFNFCGITIPSYGLMIAIGVVTANLLALFSLKKYKLDGNDFLILEGYVFLGAFIGAKLLYIIASFRSIDWNNIFTNLSYFNDFMKSGFVFYGGLIGGLLFLILGGKLHHINYALYAKHFIFLIPWIHGFGRIGCFLAGCCYGIPYNGIFSVRFPKNSLAPANINLFPIQLAEAIFLFFIAIIIFLIDNFSTSFTHTTAIYFISYSILRFILEFFRYDEIRGKIWNISTSQWISLGLFGGTVIYLYSSYKHKNKQKKLL